MNENRSTASLTILSLISPSSKNDKELVQSYIHRLLCGWFHHKHRPVDWVFVQIESFIINHHYKVTFLQHKLQNITQKNYNSNRRPLLKQPLKRFHHTQKRTPVSFRLSIEYPKSRVTHIKNKIFKEIRSDHDSDHDLHFTVHPTELPNTQQLARPPASPNLSLQQHCTYKLGTGSLQVRSWGLLPSRCPGQAHELPENHINLNNYSFLSTDYGTEL